MALGLPIALLAGLVSFFSPCVLPLLPGYLSYATGMGAADITTGQSAKGAAGRGRVLLGTLGFVAGFTAVFVATGALMGSVGAALFAWQRPLMVAAGVLSIALGLVFTDWLPWGRGTWRLQVLPEPAWRRPRCWESCSGWGGRHASARRYRWCSRWP